MMIQPFLPQDSYAKRGICRRRVSVCVSVTYLDETAKIDISNRISQQLLDQTSSAFQHK